MAQWRNHSHHYGRISQSLHWLMAFLILFMLGLGLLMDILPGPWKPVAIDIHKSVGITLLLLLSARLYWRLSQIQPALPDTMHALHILASQATHWLLYGLMIVMPITGWAMSSALGRPVVAAGFTLPDWVEKDRALGVVLRHLHSNFSYMLMGVIALHIAAALYHHFICHDTVLKRMLPERHIR